jgi:hypothetical protein
MEVLIDKEARQRTQVFKRNRYKLNSITEVEVVKDAYGKVEPGLGVRDDVLVVVGW